MDASHLIPITTGADTWFWSHNHCYVYVFDADCKRVFAINTNKPTADLVLACIEAYRDGRGEGHREGYLEKAAELRRALGIYPPPAATRTVPSGETGPG